MKKICVLGAALIMFAAKANAQVVATDTRKVGPVHFGIEAGGNLNRFADADWNNYGTSSDTRGGWHGGFVVNFGSGHFTVQPGLRYIMKGGKTTRTYSDPFTLIQTENVLKLHYLEMPLNLIYNTGYWGEGRFMIGAGPYVSLMLTAKDRFRVATTNRETGEVVTTEGNAELSIGNRDEAAINRWDVGGDLFIGYQFNMGLYLKVTGMWSGIDAQKAPISGQFYNRNTNLLFSLGYLFGYKCK